MSLKDRLFFVACMLVSGLGISGVAFLSQDQSGLGTGARIYLTLAGAVFLCLFCLSFMLADMGQDPDDE